MRCRFQGASTSVAVFRYTSARRGGGASSAGDTENNKRNKQRIEGGRGGSEQPPPPDNGKNIASQPMPWISTETGRARMSASSSWQLFSSRWPLPCPSSQPLPPNTHRSLCGLVCLWTHSNWPYPPPPGRVFTDGFHVRVTRQLLKGAGAHVAPEEPPEGGVPGPGGGLRAPGGKGGKKTILKTALVCVHMWSPRPTTRSNRWGVRTPRRLVETPSERCEHPRGENNAGKRDKYKWQSVERGGPQ